MVDLEGYEYGMGMLMDVDGCGAVWCVWMWMWTEVAYFDVCIVIFAVRGDGYAGFGEVAGWEVLHVG